jgi:superfamily II DNA or RNA helicase
MTKLRKWQQEAIDAYEQQNTQDFLLTATPGAGKTTCALAIAKSFLDDGSVQRLVVVVPTKHLQKQWRKAATKFGIHLSAKFANADGREAADYHGVVLTYHQVASQPALHRLNCGRTPTFAILDEPHHAGHENTWGDGLLEAFHPAARRLLITGTAFRSDNAAIPFVLYEEQRSVPHFSYSYEQALREGVCRYIIFPTFEGEMRWMSKTEEKQATFADLLPEAESARRLRTALSTHGEWLPSVLKEANNRLTEIRQEQYPKAGGLIIAIDQQHAREIADLLARITGEYPVLAISDEEDSSAAIAAFAESMQRWLVSVKMVSEGVDIPRLCVGVYATNVLTELYFRQVVGRFVRMIKDVDVEGWLYIPKDPTLVEYARRIEEERDHVLLAEDDTEPKKKREGDGPSPSGFVPLGSQACKDDVLYNNDVISQREMQEAEELLMQHGVRNSGLTPILLAKILRTHTQGASASNEQPDESAPPPPPDREHQKTQLRNDVNLLARIFAGNTALEVKQVNKMLWTLTRKGIKERTLEELELCKTTLKNWYELGQQENAPNGYDAWCSLAQRSANRSA